MRHCLAGIRTGAGNGGGARLRDALCGAVAGSLVLLAGVGALPLAAGVTGYHFVLPVVDAGPGEHVRITVKGEHERSAQGFVLAARYPAASLNIERVHIEDTILEAIEVDFFEASVSPEDGTLIVAVLVDSRPPFDGELIPNIGFGLNFFHIEATVSPEAEGDLTIALENGLSIPPVSNLYSVDNQSIPVSELSQGGVHVGSIGRNASFIRGDVNMDEDVDISDPITVLRYAFEGAAEPRCMLAADANDDDAIDISDPIFILEFLFSGGRVLPSPRSVPGRDPTPGLLGCLEGM
jgi:hypothetical protein